MPFTHVEIEERRSRTLVVLFATLVLLYAASCIALVWGAKVIFGFSWGVTQEALPGPPWQLSSRELLGISLLAVTVTGMHWLVATSDIVNRVVVALGARPLDPRDSYHAVFKNIVEEVSVATGGRYRITPHIIPTTATNACAAADFSNRAVIIATEGLLARLNRAQLEAVVGHEAAHIARGDSLSRSVFCGLFGLHEQALEHLSGAFDDGHIRVRGRAGGFMLFVIVVLWLTKTAKRFCELAISRQQEYRADAVAVRLVRNPLALAEALHVISNHWRGVGTQGQSLTALFTVDTGADDLSEHEGLFASMFSTHPPVEHRLASLLGMVHIDPSAFERTMDERADKERPRQQPPAAGEPPAAAPGRWFARLRDAWLGPLTLEQLTMRKELSPETWVRREREESATMAYQDPQLLEMLRGRHAALPQPEQPALTDCPKCRMPLTRVLYEGVTLTQCPSCRGCYLLPDQIARIFAREEYAFPDEVRRLGDLMLKEDSAGRTFGRIEAARRQTVKWKCPKCASAVVRKFYTEAYTVEVEQCWACGLTWLDHQELELLQYLHEKRRRLLDIFNRRDPTTTDR